MSRIRLIGRINTIAPKIIFDTNFYGDDWQKFRNKFMEVIQTKKIASAELAEVLVSADEIEIYQTALEFALSEMSEDEIEDKFGASRGEIKSIAGDLRLALEACMKNQSESVLA